MMNNKLLLKTIEKYNYEKSSGIHATKNMYRVGFLSKVFGVKNNETVENGIYEDYERKQIISNQKIKNEIVKLCDEYKEAHKNNGSDYLKYHLYYSAISDIEMIKIFNLKLHNELVELKNEINNLG